MFFSDGWWLRPLLHVFASIHVYFASLQDEGPVHSLDENKIDVYLQDQLRLFERLSLTWNQLKKIQMVWKKWKIESFHDVNNESFDKSFMSTTETNLKCLAWNLLWNQLEILKPLARVDLDFSKGMDWLFRVPTCIFLPKSGIGVVHWTTNFPRASLLTWKYLRGVQ